MKKTLKQVPANNNKENLCSCKGCVFEPINCEPLDSLFPCFQSGIGYHKWVVDEENPVT